MTDATLRQALAYARRGWPVFPCLPGQKIPATTHGYKDATTDEQQITEWFGHGQRWNLAIATGTPGPDVLDIDQHGQAGNGYPAFARLAPGRTGQRRRRLRTDPSRRNARLLRWLGPAQWPPAQPPPRLPCHRRLHRGPALPGRRQALPRDQQTRRPRHPRLGRRHRFLEPQRQHERPAPGHVADRRLDQLARWVARQSEGNRNAGLYWAANRALDANPAADLSPLAAAARQAGLGEPEITRTLDSARRTRQPDRQAEEIN